MSAIRRRTRPRAARAAAALACVALLAVAGAAGWLHSAPGRAWLLGKLLEGVNAAIHGRLEARALALRGGTFTVSDLALRAPGGAVVATAARAEGIPLWPLVRRRLVLDGARLEGLRLRVAIDDDGVDLFRAASAAPRRADGGGGGGLELSRVEVGPARIELVQRRWPDAAPRAALEVERGSVSRRGSEAPLIFAFEGRAEGPVAAPVRAEIALRNTAALREVDVAAELGALRARLALRNVAGATVHRLHQAHVDPAVARALWPRWPLGAPLDVRGDVVEVRGVVDAGLAGAVGGRPFEVEGELDLPRGFVQIRSAEAELAGARVAGRGALGPGGRLELEAQVSRPARPGEPPARLSAGGVLSVAEKALRLDALRVERGPLRWRLERPACAALRGGAISVDRLALRSGADRVALSGTASGERLDARAEVRVSAATVAALARAAGAPWPVAGTVAATARVRGPPSRLVAVARADARLSARGGPPLSVRARAGFGPAGARLVADLRVRAARATLAARSVEPLEALVRRAREGALADAPFRADLRVPPLALASLARAARGTIALEARARGTPRAPRIVARATGTALGGGAGPRGDGEAAATWDGARARLHARLAARTGGVLTADATLRPREGAPLAEAELEARGEARALDPAPLAALVPGLLRAGGRVDGELAVGGALAAPRARWEVRWTDGRVDTRERGRHGPFRLEARGDGVAGALRLEGESGGGRVALALRAERDGDDRARLAGRLALERFPIVERGELQARATIAAELGGAVRPGLAELRARVQEGTVELPSHAGGALQPLARPEGVVVAWPGGAVEGARDPPRAESEPPPPPTADPGRTWALVVTTDRPVAVHGDEVDLRVAAAPELRVEWTRRLLLFGALRAERGRLEVLGSRLDVLAGAVLRFDGPPEVPFVDVGAAGELRRGARSVHARGGPSGRAASATRLYELAGGRAREARATGTHGTVEGRGWGSVLTRALAARLPFGAFLERGVAPRTAEVRTPVTGRVDVGATSRLAGDPAQGENRRTTRLGVRLRPGLTLEGTAGDAGDSGIDVVWSRER